MSFEMMFLFGCLSLLGAFIVVLTISTVIMGSRNLLRLQHVFSSLKYDKSIDEIITRTLAKYEAGLLIARLSNNEIHFYTQEEMEERIKSDGSWGRSKSDTYSIAIWVGNKFTQYGYLRRYHDQSSYTLEGKCGSYKTFRAILDLEDELSGRKAKIKEPEVPAKPKKEVVELE